MATPTQTATAPHSDAVVDQKIRKLKELYADAPELITAGAWYVANPNLTVAETRRAERVGKAVDEFLDKIA